MWLKAIPVVLLALIVAVAAVVSYGGSRWRAGTETLHARLQGQRLQTSPNTYDQRELADLPTPVQRYFQAVLKENQPFVSEVNASHVGTFNMSETAEKWMPFTSTQRIATQRPGFLWDARIRMMPGMTVFVRDAYVAGEGVLAAKLFGFITVMEQPSTPELAQGELMRFLAEAAWYPTALLPSQGVFWEPIDDTHASATLTDGTSTARLVFEFDAQGLISSVHSDGRYRQVDSTYVATPWEGRFWDYQLRDGILVPTEGEVAWLFPDGPKPYWRGRVQRIEYEFAQ